MKEIIGIFRTVILIFKKFKKTNNPLYSFLISLIEVSYFSMNFENLYLRNKLHTKIPVGCSLMIHNLSFLFTGLYNNTNGNMLKY